MAVFREPVSFPGHPAESGNGNLIFSDIAIAINNACDDKETAWQFIASLLSDRFQSDWNYLYFPIRKSMLKQKIEQEMAILYETDENGNKQEVKKGTLQLGTDRIDYFAAREGDAAAILGIIESADTVFNRNMQVHAIIIEEAQAYFSGQKSVLEVVDVIENRIMMHLSEME
jgi:ABC-type glycerol-3-phosphate transport system substrate-binding protein